MLRLPLLFIGVLLISCGDNNKRTQEPLGPLPYESNEVSFKSLDRDLRLAGTLTTPTTDSLKTAVILVGGSGPDNRDYSNQFGHRPFLVLAHYLTQQGITVLRYDERGVGKSAGNYPEATYEQMASDVAGGVRYLREKGFQKVGIIGHSEGGGMAPVASQKAKTDFLVLMAADNTTADKSLVYQTDQQLKSMSVDAATRQEITATLDSLMSILKAEPNAEAAKAKMEKLVIRKNQTASEEYKKVTARLGDANRLIDGFLDPKFIYRLHNDPKESFRQIRVPVLVLYGPSDGLLDVDATLPLMEEALASTEYQVKLFSGLGHLFMNAKGVPMGHLHQVEETIAPEVLTTIGNWIKEVQ